MTNILKQAQITRSGGGKALVSFPSEILPTHWCDMFLCKTGIKQIIYENIDTSSEKESIT
jgi:hypothetical protein